MSSSEEYLDSLLKSLIEGESQISADSLSETPESNELDGVQGVSDSPMLDEEDKAMSMNEIEAMFASIGETPEEELTEEPVDEIEEAALDDFVLDESLMPEEMALEEEGLPDDIFASIGGTSEEELAEEPADEIGEATLDDFVLDESLMPEEMALEEEELPEEDMLDDLILDDSLENNFDSNDMESGNAESDDFALSDLGLDDLGLDDLGLEDLGLEENGQMEEEVSADDEPLDDFALNDFALEESGEDDEDLSALLAGMGSDDDLAEINDLLEKADQGMSGDDDMLAMLGGVSGLDEEGNEESYNFFSEEGELGNIHGTPSEELAGGENAGLSKKEQRKAEKERKKKEKEERKKKKKKGAQEENVGEDDELNNLLAGMDVGESKPEKQGFFAKIINALLEEDEDEEANDAEGEAGSEIGNLSDENRELLAELKAEDKKNAKKKDKKNKKGKKGKKNAAEDGAEGEGEEGEEKGKKPKKEKKKKKQKEQNPEDETKAPEKKLSRKKVMSVFLFCATVAACIIVLSTLLPSQIEKQEARVAYDYRQYEQVYDLLYGKKLNEEDEALFQKSSIILQTKRKLESYENYTKLDMSLEALNALLEGVNRYQNLRDEAEQYRISDELYDVYEQILNALADSYGVGESEALEILSSGDDVTYSQRLQSIVYGDIFGSEEELPEVKQDILPEEEEIIDRLQGTDGVEVDDEVLQPEDGQAQTEEVDDEPQAEEIDEVMQAEEGTL